MTDELIWLCRSYVSYVDLLNAGLGSMWHEKELDKTRAALTQLLLRASGKYSPSGLYDWCKEQISITKRTGKRPWRMGMHLRGWFGGKDRRHKRAKLKADRRFRWHLAGYEPSGGSGPYYQVGWMTRRRCYPRWTGRKDVYKTISFEEERYEEDDDE